MLLATSLLPSGETIFVVVAATLAIVVVALNPSKFSDLAFDRDVEKAVAAHGAAVGRVPGTPGVYFDIVGFGARLRVTMRRPRTREQGSNCQSVVLALPEPVMTFTAPILFSNSPTRSCLLRAFERRFTLVTDDLATFVFLIPIPAQAEFVRLTARLAVGSIRGNGRQIMFGPGVDLRTEIPAILALFGGIAERAETLRRSRPADLRVPASQPEAANPPSA